MKVIRKWFFKNITIFNEFNFQHMFPADLDYMFARLHNLNTAHGFPANTKPFIVGEVIDHGNDVISGTEYFGFSTITEFRYSNAISRSFSGNDQLRWLRTFGEGLLLWNSSKIFFYISFEC